jgi:hypothetical protein
MRTERWECPRLEEWLEGIQVLCVRLSECGAVGRDAGASLPRASDSAANRGPQRPTMVGTLQRHHDATRPLTARQRLTTSVPRLSPSIY